MKLNRNTEVESLQVSPPDAKPVLYAVPSLVYNEDCVGGMKRKLIGYEIDAEYYQKP